jgi:hypothetical protein
VELGDKRILDHTNASSKPTGCKRFVTLGLIRTTTSRRLCFMAWRIHSLLASAADAPDSPKKPFIPPNKPYIPPEEPGSDVVARPTVNKTHFVDTGFMPLPPSPLFPRSSSSGVEDLMEVHVEGEQERERARMLLIQQQALERRYVSNSRSFLHFY